MIRLSTSDPSFDRAFTALVNARREADADVARDVRTIVASVRDEGDAAIAAFTRKFDRHDLNETGWRIEKAEWLAALDGLAPGLRAGLDLAAARITAYHLKQRPTDSDNTDAAGVTSARGGTRSSMPESTSLAAARPIRLRC